MSASELLTELSRLTQEEFEAFFKSGAFTGFTEQDLTQAHDADRGKMELFNEAFRLSAEAKRLKRRRGHGTD
jgi:hypothetical protein